MFFALAAGLGRASLMIENKEERLARKVRRRPEWVAHKVANLRKCLLIKLRFFGNLTFSAVQFMNLTALKVAKIGLGLQRIEQKA